jgi:hypothetical protein
MAKEEALLAITAQPKRSFHNAGLAVPGHLPDLPPPIAKMNDNPPKAVRFGGWTATTAQEGLFAFGHFRGRRDGHDGRKKGPPVSDKKDREHRVRCGQAA